MLFNRRYDGDVRPGFMTCRNLVLGVQAELLPRIEALMKVVVDLTLCDLHGLCVDTAPEVFEIADDGALKVLIEAPPEALRGKVEKAARECPTAAITIED